MSKHMVLAVLMVQALWVSCSDELQPASFSIAATTSSIRGVALAEAAQPLCQASQRAALLEFYNGGFLNFGLQQEGLFTWFRGNATHDCCDWPEVTCDTSGYVVSLSIDSINSQEIHLNASTLASMTPWPIPLAKLRALQALDLSFLYFASPLPSEIGLLSRTLSSLSITNSNLRPPVPWAALSNLTSLTHLTLSKLALEGRSLPSEELCNLTRLQVLDLNLLGVRGTIPSCLSSLSHLSYLDLSANQLIGFIPQHWNANSSLLHLALDENELTGPIFSGLFGQDLQYLALDGNNLTGNIPETIGNLTKLAHLSLADNQLSGPLPEQWGNLSNLASLDLSNNQLHGKIPASLGQIGLNLSSDNYAWIVLSSNSLAGDLPSSLLRNNHISLIYLQYNDLTGVTDVLSTAPTIVNSSSTLQYLDLSHNSMRGPVPSLIAGMLGLQYLDLSFNKLASPLDKSANFSASSILTLDLSFNQLTVPIPSWISHITFIKLLNLSSNQLEGTIPPWLWSLQFLQQVDLSMNRLNGNISLDGLCTLRSYERGGEGVQFFASNNNFSRFFSEKSPLNNTWSMFYFSLDLHSNNLYGVVPWEFFLGKYQQINLDLADNSFIGEFPGWIGDKEMTDLSTLGSLDLSHNLLSGTIPATLSKYGIISLKLSFNLYSGKIPPSICHSFNMFRSLGSLKLAHNSFSGFIPDELGQCKGLKSLVLVDNQLTGPIPSALTNLSSTLVVLDLSHNHLTGGLPAWIQQMHSLRVLSFSFNGLSGLLPSTTWNNTQLQVLDLSNNNLSGPISAQSLSLLQGFHYSSISRAQTSSSNTLYEDSITIQGKGQNLVFVYLLMATVSLDLSNNALVEHIPPQLGSLDGLVFLNLSNNYLTGQIPESVGNLRQLNSLDVSRNDLEGEISKVLCSLTFLSTVDVSYNDLRGSIPQCNQWSTFPQEAFLGNKGLCGPPLALPCPSNSSIQVEGPMEKDHASDHDFLIAVILGSCISFPLCFATSFLWFPASHRIYKASQWILGKLGAYRN